MYTMRVTLPPGIALRHVETDADREGYAALNEAVAGEGQIARRLIDHRPGGRRQDFIMAVEASTGRVVSTTCLLRWKLMYGPVPLSAAMLEMVVTEPAFRRHGLVRAQIDVFHEQAADEGADLCIIQGIPYYYRQFGYGYALDHTPVVDLPVERAARAPRNRRRRLGLRAAAPADVGVLAELYELEMSRQALHVARAPEDWTYLLAHAGRAAELITREGIAEPVGYVCAREEAGRLDVAEAGLRDPADAPALLGILAARAQTSIAICGNGAHCLCGTARELGAAARIPAQWLIRIPGLARLLLRIAPVLQQRLGRAGLVDADAELTVNLYRAAFRVTVRRGKIVDVTDAGFRDASLGADGGDLCIPPDAFTRLVLGYRDIDQLRDAWPDISLKPGARALVEALFPRTHSLVLMPY
jgi:predicted N-acetyltransferase YhbS